MVDVFGPSFCSTSVYKGITAVLAFAFATNEGFEFDAGKVFGALSLGHSEKLTVQVCVVA